ncbi:MAG: hydrogenase maturation protease [Acidobacteriia bacterium]|nr:hydrogenase maturation protease [Terriglobia bacterium]
MKVLVACVGNIFLGDDGFGTAVAQRLAARNLPGGAVVRDFGIRGLDLAYALLNPWDLVLLVDACPRGGDPGTIYVIEPEIPQPGPAPYPHEDPHDMNPLAMLSTVHAMGGAQNPILIVGCEPGDLGGEEGRLGLTPAVEAAVDEAIAVIENLLSQFARGQSLSMCASPFLEKSSN